MRTRGRSIDHMDRHHVPFVRPPHKQVMEAIVSLLWEFCVGFPGVGSFSVQRRSASSPKSAMDRAAHQSSATMEPGQIVLLVRSGRFRRRFQRDEFKVMIHQR